MKKIGLIAAAATLAAAGAAFGQGSVELRIVGATEPVNNGVYDAANPADTSTALESLAQDAPITKVFYMQGRTTGDATITGISAFNAIFSSGADGGFSPAALSATDVGFAFPGFPDSNGQAGLLPAFRAILEPNAAGNDDVGNGAGTFSDFRVLLVSTSPTGSAASDWSNLYKFTFTTTANAGDLGAFDISVVAEGATAGVQTTGGLIQVPVVGGSYSFTLVPAPGAFALMGLGGLLAARRRR